MINKAVLTRTGLTKFLSGGSQCVRSALATSRTKSLLAGRLALLVAGSRGILSRSGFAGVADLTGVDTVAPVGVAFAALYLAPSKPQLGQSL